MKKDIAKKEAENSLIELSEKNVRSSTEIFEYGLPKIRDLLKHEDTDLVMGKLLVEICKIEGFFDIEINNQTYQLLLEEITQDPLTKNWAIQDINLAIKQSAKNAEVYGRLDFNTVWQWFKAYEIERRKAYRIHRERIERAKKAEREKNHKPAPMPEDLKGRIDKLFQENKDEINDREKDIQRSI